jgi:hypothetical protein
MSKFLRQSIVPIAAIIGVQAANLVLSPPRQAQSSSCLQWASDAIDAAREAIPQAEPPRVAEDGYYDVRQHKDVALPVAPATPTRHADATDPATLGTQASASVDGAIAASPDVTASSEYQQERLAIAQERDRLFGGH